MVRIVRTRIAVGCEGQSERAYSAWLQRLVEELKLPLFLDSILNVPGGGDPLYIVRARIAEMARREARHGRYERKAIILDHDTSLLYLAKREEAIRFAAEANVTLIWQDPDHEALLLRHCEGCAAHRPPRGESIRRLRERWPGYQKPSDALALSRLFQLEHLRSACATERELARFLREIGFPID
jgi:hypothetical protein